MEKLPSAIGCAFLANAGNLNSGGIASFGGGESFRFTDLATLAHRGPLWITSISESQFLIENGLMYPFLRHANYFPTPLLSIAQELGSGGNIATEIIAQRVSEVLSRVVGMVDQLCPGPGVAYSLATTLAAHMQACVAPSLRRDDMPPELADAMQVLFKASPPLRAAAPGDISIRIPANRIRLSEIVLNSSVPGGSWSEIDISEFPAPAMALSSAIGNHRPIFCLATIKGPAHRGRDAEGFSSSGKQFNEQSNHDGSMPMYRATSPFAKGFQGQTRWMALPEIVALSKIVNLTPKKIFVSSEILSVHSSLAIPSPLFSAAAAASISAGLFTEAYLHAVSLPSLIDLTGSPLVGTQTYSARGAWLTSVARSYMFQEAMNLADANFNVTSFGSTHLMVSIQRRGFKNLRKYIGASSLLSYPTGLRVLEPSSRPSYDSVEMSGGMQ